MKLPVLVLIILMVASIAYSQGTRPKRVCRRQKEGSLVCDPLTAACRCSSAWTGILCSEDVDECATQDHNCTGDFERCVNTPGSFFCACQTGYSKNPGSTICTKCDRMFYGADCKRACPCNFQNTAACGGLTGKCDCFANFTGVACTDPVASSITR